MFKPKIIAVFCVLLFPFTAFAEEEKSKIELYKDYAEKVIAKKIDCKNSPNFELFFTITIDSEGELLDYSIPEHPQKNIVVSGITKSKFKRPPIAEGTNQELRLQSYCLDEKFAKEYMGNLEKKIQKIWGEKPAFDIYKSILSFHLDNNGNPVQIKVLRSGGEIVDESNIKILKKAAPFGPFPLPTVEVQFTFNYANLFSGTTFKNAVAQALIDTMGRRQLPPKSWVTATFIIDNTSQAKQIVIKKSSSAEAAALIREVISTTPLAEKIIQNNPRLIEVLLRADNRGFTLLMAPENMFFTKSKKK